MVQKDSPTASTQKVKYRCYGKHISDRSETSWMWDKDSWLCNQGKWGQSWQVWMKLVGVKG